MSADHDDSNFDQSDVDAINALLRRTGEFFTQGDMESWSGLFTEKADFISWGGLWWTSRAAIHQGHDAIDGAITTQLPAYRFEPLQWEALAPTVALAHGRWDWPDFRDGDAPAEDRAGLLTLVLLRSAGIWKIRAAQNSRTDARVRQASA